MGAVIDQATEHALRLWGRWASCRPPEPHASCFSVEGRWTAPRPEDDGTDRNPRAPALDAQDRAKAALTERVILTLRRQEIGALCVAYAGMGVREAQRVHHLRPRSLKQVLPHARFNLQIRLQDAQRAASIMSDIAAALRSMASPQGGRVVPEESLAS